MPFNRASTLAAVGGSALRDEASTRNRSRERRTDQAIDHVHPKARDSAIMAIPSYHVKVVTLTYLRPSRDVCVPVYLGGRLVRDPIGHRMRRTCFKCGAGPGLLGP